MKSLYLIFGALIIALIAIIFVSTPNETVTPAPETSATETQTTQDENPTAEDMGMTAEEHAAMMGESTQGTDVGMEMPIMDDMPMGQGSGETKMFDISGENFVFDIKEIRVKEGDTVMIHFKSADGFHDLVIDEFNVQTEKVRTGGMSMVTFVADKKGTFEYYCSVGSHRASGMVGTLIVE